MPEQSARDGIIDFEGQGGQRFLSQVNHGGTSATIVMEKTSEHLRISALIPTRNEALNLYHILPHIPSIVSEVILVDGHSTDDTITVALQLLPTIHIIRQAGRGKGDAVSIGLAACTGDIIVMLDGDGSTDPREIPLFVAALQQGHDFAKGSRFMQGGASSDITYLRRLGNYCLCQLVNLLFWVHFSDLCYGYNAFWRSCLEHMTVDCSGFEVETQISLRIHKAGLHIVEVPSTEHPRIYGQSHLRTFRDGWRVLKTIMKERISHPSPPPTQSHATTATLSQSLHKKVPILMYHSISDQATPQFKPFAVSPAQFADQMAYLHQHAYTPITITQFVHALASSTLPERPVILTFDDGFADFYTEALPVLKRYGFAATLYVATAFVNQTSCWLQREKEAARPMLTWEQLQEISASGIECGAHSHSHLQLDTLPPHLAEYEIVQSKKLLEEHLDQKVTSFAYPFGYYTTSLTHQVQQAGYTSACAVRHELSSEASNFFALGRLMVKADSDMDSLAALLTGRSPLAVTTLCLRARTALWQSIRRGSALLTRYPQRRLSVQ